MLSRWQATIVDGHGNAMRLEKLIVLNESDQSPARMWENHDGTISLLDGVVYSDQYGYAFFYAQPGLYRIKSDALGFDWRDVPLGALAGRDAGAGLVDDGETVAIRFGSEAGTATEGNDPRIAGALQKIANLSDLDNPTAAKTSLGLGNVDNTRDADKPASTATLIALSAKLNVTAYGLNAGANHQDPNLAADHIILTNHANSPDATFYWHITTTFYGSITSTANRGQIAVQYSDGNRVYARSCYDEMWQPWARLDSEAEGGGLPVGSVYTQYPGELSPSDLFGGTWSLLFNSEGVFFRTEGGQALAFAGGVQEDIYGSHAHTGATNTAGNHTHIAFRQQVASGGTQGQGVAANTGVSVINVNTSSAGNHSHTVTINASGGAETRPRNRTIRIWRRVD